MRQCYLCGKSYANGNTRVMLRSHYNPTSSRRKKANLTLVRNMVPGRRVLLCVKCLKTISKGKKKALLK